MIAKAIYQESGATAGMRGMPRFGASSDFSELFRSKEAAKDYIVGLLFAGLFLFGLFFAWTVCLLVFKCLGKRKVGFLSGSAFEKPKDPNAKCNRPFICRLVFLNSTFLLMIFSVLFVTQGLTNLKSTVVTVADSVRNMYQTMADVNGIVTRVELIGSNATNVASVFVTRLNNGGQACIEEELAENNPNIAAVVANVRARIQELGDFQPLEFEEFQNTTEYIATTAQNIEKETDNIEIGDWQSLIIIIPYIIVPSFLLVGVCVAWFQIDIPALRCANSWFFLPLFVVMVIFSYLFSSIISIVAAGNADFCSGGTTKTPDGTIYAILKAQGFSDEDLVFKAALWYVGQCGSDANDPFNFLDVYSQQMKEANEDVAQLTAELENSANSAVSEFCSSETQLMAGLSETLESNMVELAKLVEDSLDLMSCKNIVHLYTQPVYDGTCTYSIVGFSWAFGAFTVVAGMGLIMIMLRSSWQLDVDPTGFDGPKQLENVNKTGDDEEYDEGFNGYSPGNEDVEDKEVKEDNVEEPEQPAGGGGGYGTLDDDGEEYGDIDDPEKDAGQGDKEDDFFTQRAENKDGADPY